MSARHMGSELRMLAAGLVLGRLVLRKPAAPEPVVVRITEPAPKPRRKRDFFTTSALGIAIVSAVVSGVISFAVAHYQSEDSVKQAVTGQQIQQINQLETDIKSHFLAVTKYYYEINGCNQSEACMGKVTDNIDPSYEELEQAMKIDVDNIADATLVKEFASYENAQFLVWVRPFGGFVTWKNFNNTYDSVIARCGQLIKGQN